MSQEKQNNSKIKVSTQQFLPIKEIKEGVVYLKNGSMRVIILVSSVNFSLKSDQEKDATIFAYQSFLNSLRHPIQIVTRSRRLHLDDYLEDIDRMRGREENLLIKAQMAEYSQFISELLQSANVMEKRFFVVIPFYGATAQQTSAIKSLLGGKQDGPTDAESQKVELMERVEQVLSGLASLGLRCVVLNTEELIELFYDVYNPDTSSSQKLSDIESLDSPVVSSATTITDNSEGKNV